jgi:TRAP-type uncharacterized transport system substrate-binding protein
MRVRRTVRLGLFVTIFVTAWLAGLVGESFAQTRRSTPSEAAGGSLSTNVASRKEEPPRKDTALSENRYTVGFVTGAPNTTEFAIAQDLAKAVENGQETGPHGEVALRVLPMVGNGGTRNIADVLTLAGADMAIAPVVLVDRLRDARTLGDVRGKLVYIAPLYIEEFHLLARPEIKSLTELAGKSVNLGEEGSASALLGREVLNGLGVKINESNFGLDVALEGMRKGQISATLVVSGKPVNFLARDLQIDGIHFLPIPYSPQMQQDYLPSSLRQEDYPNIIRSGERVDTIAVKSALFAYNWPARSERFRLMDFFVQTLFSRIAEFSGETHHPKWREVNLSGQLPGWQRFRPAERYLQGHPSDDKSLREAFARFMEPRSIGDPSEREQLFQQFLRWRERQQVK